MSLTLGIEALLPCDRIGTIYGPTDRRSVGAAITSLSRTRSLTKCVVLSLVATAWDQVDYRIRQLMPWAVLQRGPTLAADTLLLDYVAQAQPMSLWNSAKARHFPVTLSAASVMIIKLLIVLSTGLLSPQSTQWIIHHAPLLSDGKFDATAWNSTLDGAIPATFAFAVQSLNMSYPPGTSDQYAIPVIKVADPANGSLTSTSARPCADQNVQCQLTPRFR